MTRKPFRLAAAAALTLAIATLGLATPANADNPALIDPTATGTLHITKYDGAPVAGNDNGLPNTDITGVTPLAGATFTIYPVNMPGTSNPVNLTTNAGWLQAAAYYDNVALAEANKGTSAGACTTAANTGQCDLPNLPLGLYYVEETAAPSGYTKAKPFLVTLPMTHPVDRDAWLYEVYVYPKNQLDTITKAVADQGTQSTEAGQTYGDAANHTLKFTLTSTITDNSDPSHDDAPHDNPLGMYVIHDDLAEPLTLTAVEVKVGDTTLASGTDYRVYTAAAMAGPFAEYAGGNVSGGPAVAIVLTDAGLTTLQANRDKDVVTTLTTTLGKRPGDGVGETNGVVENSASFIPNETWWNQNKGASTVDPEDPATSPPGANLPSLKSNAALSKYGDVRINKHDAKDASKIPGAVFTVYKDPDNDGACAADEMVGANRIGVTAPTDATGFVEFKGLQTSDFYDGATQTTAITYCLVETEAAEGYNLLAEPIPFTIQAKDDGTLAIVKLDIANEKQNLGNALPLTGGEGIAVLSLGGLVLVGGGLAYAATIARRRRQA